MKKQGRYTVLAIHSHFYTYEENAKNSVEQMEVNS